MATKKVKKFGRGGDIVTGIGAALLGKALYDKYTGKDDSKATESSSRNEGSGASTPKPRISEEVEKAQKKSGTDSSGFTGKTEDRKEYKPAGNEGKENIFKPGMKYVKPEASVPTSGSKPVRVIKDDKKDDKGTTTNNAPPFKGNGMAGSDKGAKSKTYPLNNVPNESRQSKSYPSSDVTAATKKAVRDKENEKKDKGYEFPAVRRAVRETVPYLSSMTDPRGTPGMRARNADPSRAYLHEMAEKGKQKEKERKAREAREAEEKAKKRKGASEIRYDEMGNAYKRGGAVKKYASGGSVKTAKPTMRSASSRADGIAIRGKTRA